MDYKINRGKVAFLIDTNSLLSCERSLGNTSWKKNNNSSKNWHNLLIESLAIYDVFPTGKSANYTAGAFWIFPEKCTSPNQPIHDKNVCTWANNTINKVDVFTDYRLHILNMVHFAHNVLLGSCISPLKNKQHPNIAYVRKCL